MKFLVFEYFSSISTESSLLKEGLPMLKLIAEGLHREKHEVSVIIADRLSNLFPDSIRIDKSRNFLSFLDETVKELSIDYVFPIAPDKELADIVFFCRKSCIKTFAAPTLSFSSNTVTSYPSFFNNSIILFGPISFIEL